MVKEVLIGYDAERHYEELEKLLIASKDYNDFYEWLTDVATKHDKLIADMLKITLREYKDCFSKYSGDLLEGLIILFIYDEEIDTYYLEDIARLYHSFIISY